MSGYMMQHEVSMSTRTIHLEFCIEEQIHWSGGWSYPVRDMALSSGFN